MSSPTRSGTGFPTHSYGGTTANSGSTTSAWTGFLSNGPHAPLAVLRTVVHGRRLADDGDAPRCSLRRCRGRRLQEAGGALQHGGVARHRRPGRFGRGCLAAIPGRRARIRDPVGRALAPGGSSLAERRGQRGGGPRSDAVRGQLGTPRFGKGLRAAASKEPASSACRSSGSTFAYLPGPGLDWSRASRSPAWARAVAAAAGSLTRATLSSRTPRWPWRCPDLPPPVRRGTPGNPLVLAAAMGAASGACALARLRPRPARS